MTRDRSLAFKAGLALAITLLLGAQWGCLRHRLRKIQTLQGEVQGLALELGGAQRALSAKPKEIIKTVEKFIEVPVAVRQAIKEKKAEPVGSVVIETKTQVVKVPGLCPGAPPATVSSKLTGALLITWEPPKGSHWTGQLFNEVTVNNTVTGFAFDDPNEIRVTLSQEILDRLARDARAGGWVKRHFKLTCPSISLVYDISDKELVAGPGCSFGFTW